MLSRATRNAYSWWWASHIRTKQSKWLDQNLQDMEEKVEYILKIITEDGDSFRSRAEQYYRKRPEIVNFVEDTFRGYRALAERYDHLSKDLQSANRTIAIVFPERVQMTFDEEDYEDFSTNFDQNENKLPTNSNVPMPLPLPPKPNTPKMENVVQAMLKKKSKMPTKMMSKNGLIKIGGAENAPKVSERSGLSRDEALEEIDKLQKVILGFQTDKEFIKISYENAMSKYWEIENNINDIHTKISNLHQEFDVGTMIEDKEAQTLMSSSALKMCNETLEKLKDKQKLAKKEATMEHNKVNENRKKFEAFIASNNKNSDMNFDEPIEHVKDKKAKIEEKELKDFEEYTDKSDENAQSQPVTKVDQKDEKVKYGNESMKEQSIVKVEQITISEVAEKIEQLVDKVINLETEGLSQIALIMRLKFENNELHEELQTLEEEKNNLIDDSNNMRIKIKKLEEKLERVQVLDHKVKEQNEHMETSFNEVSVSIDNLSNEILTAKPDEITQEDDTIIKSEIEESKILPELKEQNGSESYENDDHEKKGNEKDKDDEHRDVTEKVINEIDVECVGNEEVKENLKLISSQEIEDREKMLLEEYSSTLRNYKEVKKRLNEVEKMNRARSFRLAVQMKMLRNSNETKEGEIRSLNERLKLLETNIGRTRDFETMRPSDDEVIETRNEFEESIDVIDEETPRENEFDATEIEIQKAQNAIDEGTHRIEELVENAHFELKKARGLVDGGKNKREEPNKKTEMEPMKSQDLNEFDEIVENEVKMDLNLVDEETKRKNEVDKMIEDELKKAKELMNEETCKTKERADGVNEENKEVLDIEDEIRTEIDDLRKENLELWLRFSTSYHQINRFQDSYNDLLQEIKYAKENGENGKHRNHHSSSSSSTLASDIGPLYRHLRDMQTEVIIWLERSGILEDDLQNRLTSLSDMQNELTDITNEGRTDEKMLNNYQAATFQGEVLNMKQENLKVLDELRVATERVKTLNIDIDKTLSKVDEDLGKKKKSNSSIKVPFRSFLFGAKLRRKHRASSLFTCMSPSLQRRYSSNSSNSKTLPKPSQDS
ncbi:protein NETWORKED 2A-like [Rutidosis leptorrhynchoides]|uniref:protein NETWORKED 2A-like n=1 Tax=Rutidosis leptorrhynchoides TaxID=125765 RepID=UPI003A99652C